MLTVLYLQISTSHSFHNTFERIQRLGHILGGQRGLLSTLYKNSTGSRVCFANFVYFVRRENFRRILKLFSAVIHWFSRVKENFWFGVID